MLIMWSEVDFIKTQKFGFKVVSTRRKYKGENMIQHRKAKMRRFAGVYFNPFDSLKSGNNVKGL